MGGVAPLTAPVVAEGVAVVVGVVDVVVPVPGAPMAAVVMVGEEQVEVVDPVIAAADMACLTGKGSSSLDEMVTLGAAETLVLEGAVGLIKLDGCC